MRKVFLILGAVLGVIVAGGIFVYLQLSKPVVSEVPVAIADIPVGTLLRSDLFRISRMANVDPQTLAKWVTLATWKQVEGKLTTSQISAGFPVARSQVDPNSSAAFETRLSLVITGTNDYYVVIPTKPDEVGNYLQPSDRIDIIISLGNPKDALVVGPAITGTDLAATTAEGGPVPVEGTGEIAGEIGAALQTTQTIPVPITKLVMQNMEVLRIDRDKTKAATNAQGQTLPQDPNTLGDIKRLYVRVNRDQLEVLSFVLNLGKRAIAVRAANGSSSALPTDGVTWDDFARWFLAQRGNSPAGANSFDAISPPEPRPTATPPAP